MDPSSSSTSFTSLMNSSTSIPGSAGPQNGYNQQYFPPPHFPRNAPAPPPYAHNFIPFGPQPGYHQTSSSYHGFPYQGSVGQYQQGSSGVGMAGDPSSPVGSSNFFFGGAGGSGSRGDESGSPLSIPQPVQASPAGVLLSFDATQHQQDEHDAAYRGILPLLRGRRPSLRAPVLPMTAPTVAPRRRRRRRRRRHCMTQCSAAASFLYALPNPIGIEL